MGLLPNNKILIFVPNNLIEILIEVTIFERVFITVISSKLQNQYVTFTHKLSYRLL